VTAYNWQEEQFKVTGPENSFKKPVKPITSKLTLDNFAKTG